MRVYAVAMTEVQDDSVISEADAFLKWDEAVAAAECFMMRCVGDFYEIDPSNPEERCAKRDELIMRESSEFQGMRKYECSYENQEGTLVLSACVQEKEIVQGVAI